MSGRKNNSKIEAVSAGGVIVCVRSDEIQVLLLRDMHYDDWTLPKGHVEKGETLEDASRREVCEEAGVTEVAIICKLGEFRRYVEKAGEWKTIHYFLMTTSQDQPLGKFESEHTETHWFPLLRLPKMYLPEQEQVIRKNQEKITAKITNAPLP